MTDLSFVKYSNPRTHAVIEDWPHGQFRTTATFSIERDPKRGERACRVTRNPKTGLDSKPKRLTYAAKVRIVDGDDGKIYIAEITPAYRFISIMLGTMDFSHETLHADDPRYAEIRKLIDA